MTLNWQTLVAAVVLILVTGLVAVVWLTRDPRSHHVRFGVFLERDGEDLRVDDDDYRDDAV